MTYKVVVADSSPSALKAAELALAGPEFEVYTFGDGLDAIEAIRDIRPDAVLVGFSLPSKDGPEIAAYVRSEEGGRQTALFYLRGTFESADVRKIAQGNHDGIIQKPFDGETLSGGLREMIDRKKDLPSLPEEPALEEVAAPENRPEKPAAGSCPLEAPADLEDRIRAVVRKEILLSKEDIRKWTAEIVSAEFNKMLVEELKNVDTRKI